MFDIINLRVIGCEKTHARRSKSVSVLYSVQDMRRSIQL